MLLWRGACWCLGYFVCAERCGFVLCVGVGGRMSLGLDLVLVNGVGESRVIEDEIRLSTSKM